MHVNTPQNNDSPPMSFYVSQTLARWQRSKLPGGFTLLLLFGLGIPGLQAAPPQPSHLNPSVRSHSIKSPITSRYSSSSVASPSVTVFARPKQMSSVSSTPQPLQQLHAPSIQWQKRSPSFYSGARRVRGRETLRLSYKFQASLGVQRVVLVYRNLASRHFNQLHRHVVRSYPRPLHHGGGEFKWSLAELPFGPGDTIEYFMEVENAAGMSCSRPAQTRHRYLQYVSPMEQHNQLLQDEKQLLQQLVLGLADRLEKEPPNPQQWSILLHRLQRNYQKVRPNLRALYLKLQRDPMARTYAVAALDTLLLRLTQRYQHRNVWLRHCTHQTQDCWKLWKSTKRHKQWKLAKAAHEDDVFAVRKLIHAQEMDLIDDLKAQLNQAHQRVRILALRHQQFHQASTKQALSHALQHLDRLLRQVHLLP